MLKSTEPCFQLRKRVGFNAASYMNCAKTNCALQHVKCEEAKTLQRGAD